MCCHVILCLKNKYLKPHQISAGKISVELQLSIIDIAEAYTHQHTNKCCLPSSILSKHNYDLGVSKFSIFDSQSKPTLSFGHCRILVASISANLLCTFLWGLCNLCSIWTSVRHNDVLHLTAVMLLVTTKLYGLLLIHNTDLHGRLRKKKTGFKFQVTMTFNPHQIVAMWIKHCHMNNARNNICMSTE